MEETHPNDGSWLFFIPLISKFNVISGYWFKRFKIYECINNQKNITYKKINITFLLLFISKDNKSCVMTLRVKWGDKDWCYAVFCMKYMSAVSAGWGVADHIAEVLVKAHFLKWWVNRCSSQILGHKPSFPWCFWFGSSANALIVTGKLSYNLISIIRIAGERGPQFRITLVPPLSRSKLN